jgi:5-methylcytosine-specific restriction endonuclease McrA
LCACNCGNNKVVRTAALVSGFTLSCGCLNRERVSETHRTHGMTGTIEYDRYRVRLRRARRHGNGGQHCVTDVRFLASMQRHRCAGCGATLNMKSKRGYNLDHRVPIARGGSNDRANLQLLCPLCNRQKAAKPEHDWQREKFGRLI